MKNNYTVSSKCTALFLLFATTYLSAQVVQKIGDNPFIINQNTVLELESTNKGFLPPRLNISQQTALGTRLPQGLLIYVTDGAHEGIQLWDGTKWIYYIDSAALALKANLESPTFTGTVGGITATMIGLGDVNNTSDLSKPISTATLTALDNKVDKVTGERLINAAEITKLANQSGTNTGDQNLSSFATISNLDLKANIASPTFTGNVSGISPSMVGLGDVNNTSDLSKPISTATSTALDNKVDKVTGERLINAAEITKLGNQSGTNTGDQNLSSFATISSLNLKANIASPTFTGTVSGINKTMVGLGNVDDTTDLLKPISTATQTALNLKANIATVTSALALKEDQINKITDINSDPTSTIKYPTVSAVKNYVDAHNPLHTIKTLFEGYEVVPEDYTLLCNNEGGAFELKLPDPKELTGRIYVIRKIDESTNVLTISPTLKLTETTFISSLNYPKTIRIQSNGENWYIID